MMRPDDTLPGYVRLHAEGELAERAQRGYERLRACTVCPRRCGVNRQQDERGFCKTGFLPVIASSGPHFGEEPPLVGRGGSGTLFVAHCNLACRYCQNYEISRCGRGERTPPETIAAMMLRLQECGCQNINIVRPVPHRPATHQNN
jgi:putative pyruvate formate lyase activating enzyme